MNDFVLNRVKVGRSIPKLLLCAPCMGLIRGGTRYVLTKALKFLK